MNLLIVDDRRDKLLALEVILAELHQNIVTASSGREALRHLLHQDFAVILLDVNMPGMDGFETAALIRQRPRSETTPIIFVSAVNDAENHVSRGYSLGAVDYILTPIVPEILRAKVAVFVDLFKKTEQVKRQAEQNAEFIRAQAARMEAEAAQESLAFLVEAGNVLACSLEHEEIFQRLAHLLVPKLGDYCTVDILDGNTSWKHIALAHWNPLREGQLRAMNEPGAPNAAISPAVLEVYQTKKPETHSYGTHQEGSLRDLARSEEHLGLLREMNISSAILVPMVNQERTLGVISILSSHRRYDPSDLSLAEAFAERVVRALDNADLYKAAQTARMEAERANLAKDQFLAMLSHELRTPLTPVLASVMALSEEPLSPETRASVEMIRRNVELEARLIDDLLDLTRISKGRLKLNLEVVDAHALLRNVLEICDAEIQGDQLEIQTDLSAKNFHVMADSARLQQIFWNLIKNAVKFTPHGGRLTLTSRDTGDFLQIEMTDSGLGIELDLLPKIFDAFEQGERMRSGGLGLGLAITRTLVELHKGQIKAESGGRDQGTRFTLLFPITTEPPAENLPHGEAPPPPARASLRVLLVEDHEDSNRSLTLLLRRRGYQVSPAYTVGGALELARREKFDVLISDMGLPDGSGLDVIRKGFPPEYPIFGIALSGFGMEADIRNSHEAGFHHHLIKPVDLNNLDEIIQRGTTEALAGLGPTQ